MLATFSSLLAIFARGSVRQRSWRMTIVAHVVIVTLLSWALCRYEARGAGLLGQFLVVMGIVEGAMLLGWRLTQLPKSQALEFILVSPLRPTAFFRAEALAASLRLVLLTLSGLPALLLFMFVPCANAHKLAPWLYPVDLMPLLVLPLVCGLTTGLLLTAWVYEPRWVRRLIERGTMTLILVYLAIGLLAGEKIGVWLQVLPAGIGNFAHDAFQAVHQRNVFTVAERWFRDEALPWRDVWLQVFVGLFAIVVLQMRAALRLRAHFQELHYSPNTGGWHALRYSEGRGVMRTRIEDSGRATHARNENRGKIGNRPLSWWAIQRVTRYSGEINVWLAAVFGGLYAAYTAGGPNWPAWLGRNVFLVFDQMGGIPMLAAALVVLAAAPASFQYGLWDASTQSRCQRLELLLLTDLDGLDYWSAAAAAAWRRGRGYLAVAVLLWVAALASGRMTFADVLGALAAAVLLWGLYFALGFRAFSRGMSAGGLGLILTVGLPAVTVWLHHCYGPTAAALLPPGGVYAIAAGAPSYGWLIGALLAGNLALLVGRVALRQCEHDLRTWYDRNHGLQPLE